MTRVAANFSTAIDISFGQLAPMIAWCQHNCVEDWWYLVTEEAGQTAGHYVFCFENEHDYINFVLWKK